MLLPFRLLRVKKWGNSYAIVLPKDLCRELQIIPGDYISLRVFQNFGLFRRCVPETIMPMPAIPVEALPPAKISRVSRD